MTEPTEQANELARQLAEILESEFDALRVQDLDQFEQLQPIKNELLTELTRLAPPAHEVQTLPQWQGFREIMLACRDAHRRNAVLMERKLEAIRGTLQSLRLEDPSSSVEVYDRLGKINRVRRRRGYIDA